MRRCDDEVMRRCDDETMRRVGDAPGGEWRRPAQQRALARRQCSAWLRAARRPRWRRAAQSAMRRLCAARAQRPATGRRPAAAAPDRRPTAECRRRRRAARGSQSTVVRTCVWCGDGGCSHSFNGAGLISADIGDALPKSMYSAMVAESSTRCSVSSGVSSGSSVGSSHTGCALPRVE